MLDCGAVYDIFTGMSDVVLIPFVCGAGGSTPGSEQGPVAAESAGLAESLAVQGIPARWDVSPAVLFAGPDGAAAHTALPPLGDPARRALVMRHCADLRDRVEAAVLAGAIPVTVGGDHAMAAGSIAGFARGHGAHRRIGLLWIDAHADINTPETSPSQAYHGMPVAALLGLGDPEFAGLGGADVPVLRPEHIFYIGLRDLDPGEVEIIDRLGIAHMYAPQVAEIGIEAALQAAAAHIARDTDYLFLSLDLDGFDPAVAPAVGTPVPGGLMRDDVLPALQVLAQDYVFSGFEVTELNPGLPGAAQTYDLMLAALLAVLPASR